MPGTSPGSKPLIIAYRGQFLRSSTHLVMDETFKSMESRYDLSILDGRRGGGPYLEKVSSSANVNIKM